MQNMLLKTDATIYLSDHRGQSQTADLRSFHIFNFGTYYRPDRKPFGRLQAVNDETLSQGKTKSWKMETDMEVALIPIVGNIHVKTPDGQSNFVEAGQVLNFYAAQNEYFEICNPFLDELVNFLHIWIIPDKQNPNLPTSKFDTGISANTNMMLPIGLKPSMKSDEVTGHIGVYDGREQGICPVTNPNEGAFVFVIAGAFEVQNRLVQSRDGLALRNTDVVEFEALSNGAVILILQAS